MAVNAGAVMVEIGANVARLQRDMGRASRIIERRTKKWKRHFDSLQKSVSGLGIALAGIGTTVFIRNNLAAADSLDQIALKLGITTDELQEFRYAAETNGSTAAILDTAYQRWVRRLGEASKGEGVLTKVLAEGNIALRDREGNLRSSGEVLNDFADYIQSLSSEQERLNAVQKAFDTEGVGLVNILRNGSAGLSAMRQEARDLGAVMDADLVKKSAEANTTLTKLNLILKGQFGTIVAGLAPLIENIGASMAAWVTANKDFIAQNAGEIIQGISDGLGTIVEIYNKLPGFIVGSAGVGIIGVMLLGPKAGAVVAAISVAAGVLRDMLSEVNKVLGDASLHQTGQYDDLIMGLNNGARAAETFEQKMSRLNAAREAWPKFGGLGGTKFQNFVPEPDKAPPPPPPRRDFSDFNPMGPHPKELYVMEHEYNEMLRTPKDFSDFNPMGPHPKELYVMEHEYNKMIEGRQKSLLDGAKSGFESYKKFAIDAAVQAEDAVTGAMYSMENAIVRFARTGELAFSNFADAVIDDLMRIVTRQLITAPLAGFFGGQGLSGGVFKMLGFANGGISTRPGLAMVSEGAYPTEAHIPMPNGRTIPVELRGEGQGGGGGGPVEVHIHEAPAETTVQRQKTSNGGERVDVFIKGMVKQTFQDGDMDAEMATLFGIQRQGW
jgi:hypothetical protein